MIPQLFNFKECSIFIDTIGMPALLLLRPSVIWSTNLHLGAKISCMIIRSSVGRKNLELLRTNYKTISCIIIRSCFRRKKWESLPTTIKATSLMIIRSHLSEKEYWNFCKLLMMRSAAWSSDQIFTWTQKTELSTHFF